MDVKQSKKSNCTKNNQIEFREIEFYFPSNIKWSCIKCGTCCGDTENQIRRVLLTEKDIKRIQKLGYKDFFNHANKDVFLGIMKKKKGKCIFYGENGCKIYKERALLCHMYPFWIERKDDIFFIKVSEQCPGLNKGKILLKDFYKTLLCYALNQTNSEYISTFN
jgi:Fe-S-cluster containining protein